MAAQESEGYSDPELPAQVEKALSNRGRGHEIGEIALDIQRSESEVLRALKRLTMAGKVESAEEWGNGHTQYYLVEEKAGK